MAKSLKLGICDLISELLADTLIILGFLKTARAISPALLESLLYCCDNILVFVKGDSRFHNLLLSFCVFIISHFFGFVCNKVTKEIFFTACKSSLYLLQYIYLTT